MSSLEFPPRPVDGHKGTFGSVCVLGGQRSEDGVVMLGAPTLAANAAMRSGCGTVMLGLPQPLIAEGITLAPTATGIELPVDDAGGLMPSQIIELLDNHAAGCSCFVIGPGFGSDWAQQQVIVALASREDRPIVLDADALNALSKLSQGQLDLHAPTIMTPHIGEYKRLAKSMGIDIYAENIEEAGAALAQAYGCVVVLKGHKTVVTDGIRLELCDEGGVELATGGSGDVLAGLIAGFLAQWGDDAINHLFDASLLGVHVHAHSGSSFANKSGNAGMLATDLLQEIPHSISTLRAT